MATLNNTLVQGPVLLDLDDNAHAYLSYGYGCVQDETVLKSFNCHTTWRVDLFDGVTFDGVFFDLAPQDSFIIYEYRGLEQTENIDESTLTIWRYNHS